MLRGMYPAAGVGSIVIIKFALTENGFCGGNWNELFSSAAYAVSLKFL